MQLLAEKPPAKSAGRKTPVSCSSKLVLIASPSLKSTHCPQIAFPETSLSARLAFAQRHSGPPGTRAGRPTPPANTQCPLWPQAAFGFLFQPLLHTKLHWFAPRSLNTAFIFLLAGLCLQHTPYLESPLCPLTSADPTSVAESWTQALPFQGSPPLPTNYTSCLY